MPGCFRCSIYAMLFLALCLGIWGWMVRAEVSSDVVIVATECTFPPYSERDDMGKVIGYDIDVVKEAFFRAGLTPSFRCTLWEDVIPNLLSGDVDAIASEMSITKERKAMGLAFSYPYMSSFLNIIARKDNTMKLLDNDGKPIVKNWTGVKVAVWSNTTHSAWLNKRVPNSTPIYFDSFENELYALTTKKVDVVVVDYISARDTMYNKVGSSDFKIIGGVIQDPEILGDGTGIAFRKDDSRVAEVSKMLKEMRTDGTLKKIAGKYFQFEIDEITQTNVE